MKLIVNYLKEEFHYTDYQIGQLRYFFEMLWSEFSKLLIICIVFSYIGYVYEFIFAVIILLSIRTVTGGLHFRTYLSCFCFTFLFFCLAVLFLPQLKLRKLYKLISLFICIIINYRIGPIVSSKRKEPNEKLRNKSKKSAFRIIFIYLLILFIVPENRFLTVGFWVIILQTLQLLWAWSHKKFRIGAQCALK